jgi:hypothetical protein
MARLTAQSLALTIYRVYVRHDVDLSWPFPIYLERTALNTSVYGTNAHTLDVIIVYGMC